MIPLGVLASARAETSGPATIIFSDNFDRANGALGSNWTNVSGAAAVWVNSNAARANSGSSYGAAIVAAAHPADQWAECAVADTEAAGNTPYAEVAVRANSTVQDQGYALQVDPLGPSWTLIRFDSGTPTTLDSGSLAGFTNGDRMRIEVEGNTIRGYWRGSLIVTETDSTYSSGTPGIAAYRQRMRLDNFESGLL